jgi:hypothetical protein
VHGKNIFMRERVLDWKPFDYFTVEQDSGLMGTIEVTFQMEPLEPGRTRLSIRLKGRSSKWPALLSRPLIKFIYTRLYDYRSVAVRAKAVIRGQNLTTSGEAISEPALP